MLMTPVSFLSSQLGVSEFQLKLVWTPEPQSASIQAGINAWRGTHAYHMGKCYCLSLVFVATLPWPHNASFTNACPSSFLVSNHSTQALQPGLLGSSSHFQAEMGLSSVARVLEMGQRIFGFCAFVRHACNIMQHMCELICLLKFEGDSDIIRA